MSGAMWFATTLDPPFPVSSSIQARPKGISTGASTASASPSTSLTIRTGTAFACPMARKRVGRFDHNGASGKNRDDLASKEVEPKSAVGNLTPNLQPIFSANAGEIADKPSPVSKMKVPGTPFTVARMIAWARK